MVQPFAVRTVSLLSLTAVTCLLTAPRAHAGGVRVIDAAGDRAYSSIAEAVQSADAGDMLLIGEGTYGSFEIDRPLSLIAAPGATVRILGSMQIRGLAKGRVLVRGLEFVEIRESSYMTIEIEDCSASVRISSCTIPQGGSAFHGFRGGVNVLTSTNVVLSDCVVYGGRGTRCNYNEPYPQGTYGAAGLRVRPGSSVALFDCFLRGGRGENCYFEGGDGPDVDVQAGAFLFASGSDFSPLIRDMGVAEVVGQTMAYSTVEPGGTLTELPGTARRYDAPSVITSETALVATVHGLPGDRLKFLPSAQVDFEYSRFLRGTWLQPRLRFLPTGFALPRIPASGIGSLTLPVPEFEPGQSVQLVSGQGLVYQRPHRPLLANALDVLVLDRSATTPDCNGNGIGDYLEVFDGLVPDTNHDLVPDACQHAGPDWYVDASAQPGGSGGPARPFRTIREGMQHALAGHEVIVADGTYSGPDNRNLSFLGTDYVVRSASGPAGCIIDCENQGRALEAFGPETRAAVFRGFTIRNAGSQGMLLYPDMDAGGAIRVSEPSAISVEDCIIEDNDVAIGSAIYTFHSAVRVRDCTVRVDGDRGVYLDSGGPHLIGTTIEDNSQRALWIVASHEGVLLSGCTIRNNTGGAVRVFGSGSLLIDNCLIANNSAPNGPGIYVQRAMTIHVKNSTLAGNSSSSGGTAFKSVTNQDGRDVKIENTIVWGNDPAMNSVAVGGNGSSTFRVDNCRVQHGTNGIAYSAGGLSQPYDYVASNAGNPQFIDLIDYRPGQGGSCIDTGNNNLAPLDHDDLDGDGNTDEPIPYDIAGNPRFVDDPAIPDNGVGTPPLIDIGAHERQP